MFSGVSEGTLVFNPVLITSHFQRCVFCLLNHLTLTFESFKHKKGLNSKDEPGLCSVANLADGQF